jgi:hypothetical protein
MTRIFRCSTLDAIWSARIKHVMKNKIPHPICIVKAALDIVGSDCVVNRGKTVAKLALTQPQWSCISVVWVWEGTVITKRGKNRGEGMTLKRKGSR